MHPWREQIGGEIAVSVQLSLEASGQEMISFTTLDTNQC